MEDYLIRSASIKDIDFIVKTIIEAEKSGTERLGLATLFDLSEDQVSEYLYQILEQEIDGCEFSITSFLVIECVGKCVAAVGGWKEGDNEDDISSALLKANLLGYILPKDSIAFAKGKADIIKGIQIERLLDTYQLEYVYVEDNYRGRNFAGKLIEAHMNNNNSCKYFYIQAFSNNRFAIKSYEKLGFVIDQTAVSNNNEIANFMPYNIKISMKKHIE